MNKTKENRNYENMNKGLFAGDGKYDIPKLSKIPYQDISDWIPFNYAAQTKDRTDTGIHFFVDDYQFSRVWNTVDYYLPLLRTYRYVCTPDFSLFVDMPFPIQLYNHYRKQWLGAYWQTQGINVIPTASWSDERSYEWCFSGMPTDGVVAISSIGSQGAFKNKERFLNGYQEMIIQLKPRTILFHGKLPDELPKAKCRVEMIPTFVTRFD